MGIEEKLSQIGLRKCYFLFFRGAKWITIYPKEKHIGRLPRHQGATAAKKESRNMTNTNEFRTRAKDEIVKLEKDNYARDISHEEIEIVTLSYVMGYIKGMFVVARNTEGRIYEISSSPTSEKLYIDVYKKEGTKVVNLAERR